MPNDAAIVEWARTLRFDANDPGVRERIDAALEGTGVRVRAGAAAHDRLYALLEGPAAADPAELQQRLPGAHWYGEAIIALAIEPAPADALPFLAQALGGPGAPAGVLHCELAGKSAIVEIAPSLTQPLLVLRIADVELARFGGYRRTELLSPLPADVLARVAAEGLQAPEIASGRILEALLEAAHVE